MDILQKSLFFVVDPAGVEPAEARPSLLPTRIHITRPSYPGAGYFFVVVSLYSST